MDQDALGTNLVSYADSNSSDPDPEYDLLLSLPELAAMTLHYFHLWGQTPRDSPREMQEHEGNSCSDY